MVIVYDIRISRSKLNPYKIPLQNPYEIPRFYPGNIGIEDNSDNQFVKWCFDNCNGFYRFNWLTNEGCDITFVNEEDAVAFKLRWL